MKKTLLTSIILFLSIISYSQTFIVNGITYQVVAGTNNTVNATDYNTSFGNQVVIPKIVLNPATNAKYSVVGIGTSAFEAKGLTSLSLSEGLTTIGQFAFRNNQLTGHLTIPNSVTYINGHGFSSNQITSLDLGTGITVINSAAFSNNQLTTLEIPGNLQNIAGFGTFGYNQITTVTFKDGAGSINLGARTFWDNPLTTVTCESTTPPSIVTGGNDDTFNTTGMNNNDRITIDLIIPSNTTGAYVTDPAAKWTGFKSVTENPTLSVSSFYLEQTVTIYPNPTNSQLSIDSDSQIESIEIINSNGETIRTIIGQNNALDVSDLSKGIYFLKIQAHKDLITKKFTKD